jgi:hypothetical protein
LAPFVGNGLYRLVLIDYKHGDWGWVALDTVTIPGRLAPAAPDENTAGAAGPSGNSQNHQPRGKEGTPMN